ncbi:MAG: amidase family protein [Acidimicrobiia bacterium]
MTDLAFLDATAQAELVRSGGVSPGELVGAAIARIETLDPELNAVVHPLFDRARAASANPADGPFRGVPMLVKDLDGYLAGAPCHQGNRLLEAIDWHPDRSSYLFGKFEQAGFVIVGKTNTPEFGLQPTTEPVVKGATRNPWSTDHSPGGSSGGSAAAVASGMVPVAHAGDGGGSIRIPASACGLFGLKPSRGRVSFGPDEHEAWAGLVNRHVLTRSVRDSAALLDAVRGYMPGDPYTAPEPERAYVQEVGAEPGRLRVGLRVHTPSGVAETDVECAAAAEDAARLLQDLGHTVEVTSPAALDDPGLLDWFMVILMTSLLADLDAIGQRAGRPVTADDVEPLTWTYAETGRSITGVQYLESLDAARAWTRRMASWWSDDQFDLLLTPTMAAPPAPLGFLADRDNPLESAGRAVSYAVYTAPFNVTGQPSMSVPLYFSTSNLPIGVQLTAAYGREDVLFRVAAQLERARPWADRRPVVHA